MLGWLEPDSGVVRIYAGGDGIVAEVLVKDGEVVEEGQAILRIEGGVTMSDGVGLDERMIQQFVQQRAYHEEQLRSTQTLAVLREADLARQVASAKTDLEYFAQELKIVNERRSLLVLREERSRQLLNQGHLSQSDFHILLEQRLALDSDRQRLQRERNAKQAALDRLLVDQNSVAEEHLIQMTTTKTEISELSQQIDHAESNRSRIIKAEKAGRVANLQAIKGQRIINTVPLFLLLPIESKLQLVLMAPVRASGFVQPGQRIRIRYDAFPFQKFGTQEAMVTEVSQSIVLPNELPQAPLAFNGPMYRIVASLDRETVEAFGRSIPLKSGMTLSADVTLEERSLIEWIFEPLLSLKGRV